MQGLEHSKDRMPPRPHSYDGQGNGGQGAPRSTAFGCVARQRWYGVALACREVETSRLSTRMRRLRRRSSRPAPGRKARTRSRRCREGAYQE